MNLLEDIKYNSGIKETQINEITDVAFSNLIKTDPARLFGIINDQSALLTINNITVSTPAQVDAFLEKYKLELGKNYNSIRTKMVNAVGSNGKINAVGSNGKTKMAAIQR